MKLLKIVLTCFYLTLLFDFINTRKRRKSKYGSTSKIKSRKNKNKDACQDDCTSKCIQMNSQCTQGMCFPNNLPYCYCWYFDSDDNRKECKNVQFN